MDQRWKVMFAVLCALFLPSAACGQKIHLPDGKGKAELIRGCTACHGTDLIVRVKKTPEDWKKTVDDMAARGVDATDEDLANIVRYLSTNFGIDKTGAAPAMQSATPSVAGAAATLSSAEIENAKKLVAQNGCLACHRVEKEGAYTGPSLNGLGSREPAEQIRAAILSPSPKLSPANSLARFITPDGKTIVGRILSQDGQSVRVISSSGEVATYARAGLRQFTMITTDPMPSYAGKITGEDLDRLVRYLASLPSVDENVQQ
jgi:putative heme-binding domain-containing protein